MSTFLEVTLYYANWCGHCVDAKKAWSELTEKLNKMGNQHNGVPIILNSFEDSQLQKKQMRATINNQDIEGFPTIKFGLNCNGNSKEFDYSKPRKATIILDYIKRVAEGLASHCSSKNEKKGSKKSSLNTRNRKTTR